MNQPFYKVPFKIPLREGTRVQFDGQDAEVLFVVAEGVILLVDRPTGTDDPPTGTASLAQDLLQSGALADPTSGPPFGAARSWLSHVDIFRAWKSGRLVVPEEARPKPTIRSPDQVLRVCSSKVAERLTPRLVFVQATLQLAQEEGIKPTKAWLEANRQKVWLRYVVMQATSARGERERDGLKPHASAKIEGGLKQCAPSASTLHRYVTAYLTHGAAGLIDNYHLCGNRSGPYSPEVNSFLAKAAREATREERPPFSTVFQRIQAAFRHENKRRRAASPRENDLDVPGRDKIRSALADTGHVEYLLRSRGSAAAMRDERPVGQGPKADRALQTVVMDEWRTDLKTLLDGCGIWDWLSDAERKRLLDKKGKPTRIWLSAAIDLAIRSILSLQFALEPSANLTLRALEMMLMDKTPWANAVDSRLPWPMQGLPEGIVMDRGPSYRNRLIYAALAELRIDYLGCVPRCRGSRGSSRGSSGRPMRESFPA